MPEPVTVAPGGAVDMALSAGRAPNPQLIADPMGEQHRWPPRSFVWHDLDHSFGPLGLP
jgi:hypothetical protein